MIVKVKKNDSYNDRNDDGWVHNSSGDNDGDDGNDDNSNGDDDDNSATNNLHGGHISLPPGELLIGRSHGRQSVVNVHEEVDEGVQPCVKRSEPTW